MSARVPTSTGITGDWVGLNQVIGDVENKTVLMFDDMITTGGTATEAVRILLESGRAAGVVARVPGGEITVRAPQVALAMDSASGPLLPECERCARS